MENIALVVLKVKFRFSEKDEWNLFFADSENARKSGDLKGGLLLQVRYVLRTQYVIPWE